MQEVSYIKIPYHEFEDLVHTHIPSAAKYEFPSDEECSSGTMRRYHVDGKLSQGSLRDIESGRVSFMAQHYFDKLCADGIIKPGTYLVDVSW